MACHLTYMRENRGVVIFDLMDYMNNMGVSISDFDATTQKRLKDLEALVGKGVTAESAAEYISGVAEVVQYVEAAQQAKGKQLDHTHSIDNIVHDIADSKYGVVLGLSEEHKHTLEHKKHHHKYKQDEL